MICLWMNGHVVSRKHRICFIVERGSESRCERSLGTSGGFERRFYKSFRATGKSTAKSKEQVKHGSQR